MVPYTILKNKELKDSDKITLSLIYSFHNNDKEIYISNNRLGDMLSISRTAASERITKLETLGYIKCNRVMINGKEKRTIVPLRMVGTPNGLVGTPNRISRSTDQSLVGEVGSIIYPLLNNKLNKEKNNTSTSILGKNKLEEQLEIINKLIEEDNFITGDERGGAYEEQFNLLQLIKSQQV